MTLTLTLTLTEVGWHDLPENSSGTLCANLASEVNLIQALTGENLGRCPVPVFSKLRLFLC